MGKNYKNPGTTDTVLIKFAMHGHPFLGGITTVSLSALVGGIFMFDSLVSTNPWTVDYCH